MHNFEGLSPADFEDLCCDLLTAEAGVRVQCFTPGRDQGIDLLIGSTIVNSAVAQCKHMAGSGFPALRRSIERVEVPKIRRLQPSRYILCTSVGLTPGNKEDLVSMLSPHCVSIEDIWGKDEIISMLRQHEDVEIKHYKLWLTSVPVLKRVLNNSLAVWGSLTEEEIRRKMSIFVQSDALHRALGILDNQSACIISGIPGIGKTTLAQILIVKLLEKGYELIVVRNDIEEALSLMDAKKKQIVYYDDFLGRTSIGDRLNKNEDSTILRLIDEANRSRRSRLVLTTREYILRDAQRLHEPLSQQGLELAKCILDLSDYSRAQKARILYNHFYFSGVGNDKVRNVLDCGVHAKIVDHKNFSPRIVEWMTLGAGPQGVSGDDYPGEFLRALDDPNAIWEHAFVNQISDDARALLLTLGTILPGADLGCLRLAWLAFLGSGEEALSDSYVNRSRFRVALKQCEGTFTRTNTIRNTSVVNFHNPSIEDYVNKQYCSDSATVSALISGSQYFDQLYTIGFMANAIKYRSDLDYVFQMDEFWDRAQGLIATPSARRRTRVGHEGKVVSFWEPPVDLGARVSTMYEWARSWTNRPVKSFIKIIEDLAAQHSMLELCTPSIQGFLVRIISDESVWGEHRELFFQMFECVGERVVAEEEVSTWSEWSETLSLASDLLGQEFLDSQKQKFSQFADEDVEYMLFDAHAVEDIEERSDLLNRAYEMFGMDYSNIQRRIHERLDEIEMEYDGHDFDDREGSIEDTENCDMTDAALDRMFDTLRGDSCD